MTSSLISCNKKKLPSIDSHILVWDNGNLNNETYVSTFTAVQKFITNSCRYALV